MNRNILLIEPNYKNKYPPIALMKLAMYHRMIGDNVCFFKGEMKDLVIKQATELCLSELNKLNSLNRWDLLYSNVFKFIKTRKKIYLNELSLSNEEYLLLNKYKLYYWRKEYLINPIWDRICITTLFTFYWDITIDTVLFAKGLVKSIDELWIGGTMATILHEKVKQETGITPWIGLMNKKHILDKENDYVVDDMSLDYSILDEIDYKYSKTSSYYGYMTRGCIRHCPFCAVPILEPIFNNYISLKEKIEYTNRLFGDQQNLLLLDNNVLASNMLPEIINEIKELGFYRGARFIEPNNYEITVRNLRLGINDNAYLRKARSIIIDFYPKLNKNNKFSFDNIIKEHQIDNVESMSKQDIINVYPKLSLIYESIHNRKRPKQRFVDFNQGLDARLINDDNISLLAQIALRPMRIAFDSLNDQEKYLKAIKCAVKYGINYFSNYLLYNFKDTPIDLYKRIELNIKLCDELNVSIYSFPMKYHPISDDLFYSNRDFLGENWNRKFIRAIQTILNATKGKIGKGSDFFYEAYGKDENEFMEILYMPEPFILYRKFFRENGFVEKWKNDLNELSNDEWKIVKKIIEENNFSLIENFSSNSSISNFLEHYLITRENIAIKNNNYIFMNTNLLNKNVLQKLNLAKITN